MNETDFTEIDFYTVFRLRGADSGYYCKDEDHPTGGPCVDVEVRYCCEPLPPCVVNDSNCEVCDENDPEICYEYKWTHVAEKIDEHFGYLGNRESCTMCNKCVVSDDGVITAHYEQGSTTPSNAGAGDPEGGCTWRVRFNETFEEMWLEYRVVFEVKKRFWGTGRFGLFLVVFGRFWSLFGCFWSFLGCFRRFLSLFGRFWADFVTFCHFWCF